MFRNHFLKIPPFFNHAYCGTFFVELNKDNSFASEESYEEYLIKLNKNDNMTNSSVTEAMITTVIGIILLVGYITLSVRKKLPKKLDNRYAKTILAGIVLLLLTNDIQTTALTIMLVNIFLALRSGDKKIIFRNHSYEYFTISGMIWFISNLVTEIGVILHTKEQGDGLVGVFADPVYYCQLYRITVIPIVMICTGLMLQRHELNRNNSDVKTNRQLLKFICAAILTGTAGFVAYRLPMRIYELAKVMSGDEYSVRIPFTLLGDHYNKLIQLPFEFADTPDDYRELIMFRFIKDFPVFVLSVTAAIFFTKLLLRMANGELNTMKNRKYLNISMALLVAASLWFNLSGLKEISMLNNGFNGIYGEVVYTMGLRSVTEPALYAVILWCFKTFLQAIPEKNNMTEMYHKYGDVL